MKINEFDPLIKVGLFFLILFFLFGAIYQYFGGGDCIEIENTNGCIIQDNIGLPLSMISLLIASLCIFLFTLKKLFRVFEKR